MHQSPRHDDAACMRANSAVWALRHRNADWMRRRQHFTHQRTSLEFRLAQKLLKGLEARLFKAAFLPPPSRTIANSLDLQTPPNAQDQTPTVAGKQENEEEILHPRGGGLYVQDTLDRRHLSRMN